MKMQRRKIVLSSTHVDRHKDKIDKQALIKALPDLTGEERLRWLANHRRDLPPLGYISEVNLHEEGNNAYVIGETFPYEERNEVEWDSSLFVEQSAVLYPLIDRHKNEADQFKISLDKNNFTSIKELDKVSGEIAKIFQNDIKLAIHTRKAEVNIPELVITIAKWHFVTQLLKPFATKFLETLGEKSAEGTSNVIRKELKGLGTSVAKSFKIAWANATPKNKGMSLILEFPGGEESPHVYLIIKTNSPELIQKGFTERNFNSVREETENFKKCLDIAEITFVLNENGHYGFRFLITRNGKCVGKKLAFKERDKLCQRIISKNGSMNFSTAAEIE
jgi:hypothetical protein